MGREELLLQVRNYYNAHYHGDLIPKKDYIPVSGKVLSAEDLENLVNSVLDMCFTAGHYTKMFEREFSNLMRQKFCLVVNSGSSANLLAIASLTSPLLEEKALKRGDEVITVATSFPTTVNPIIQNNCTPVFIDIEKNTYNVDATLLEKAKSKKTKAVIIAHTMGNPFNLKLVKSFCDKYDLWLIEDCCDAVGSKYENTLVGTYGDFSTVSFYPAHHITMGEGGALLTNIPKLKKIAESFRDWGRDCWCPPGVDNSCKKRFGWKIGGLPEGYDHKYIYSHIGYNLKATDMQAALGLSQLKKISFFISKRKDNFKYFYGKIQHLDKYLYLPKATDNSDPSWFGFPLAVKEGIRISREDITKRLEESKIASRPLFGGNLLCQPLYQGVRKRIASELTNSNFAMKNAFWLGIYPRIEYEHLDYMALELEKAIKEALR